VERQLYKSRSGWQKKIVFPFVVAARKTFLSYGKDWPMQKRRMKTIHTIRVCSVARSTPRQGLAKMIE
jgi:hypothetical protein